ncbi:DUF4263 domain-containing protein [Bacillus sp. CRN 9]|nr:DUF4263 domain-containing protein [Bacillus sp. CRN 9]
MKVYQRDYRTLMEDEQQEWDRLKKEEIIKSVGNLEIKRSLFHKYPKAARHFRSLFPNNYLDPIELKDEAKINNMLSNFLKVIEDQKSNELSILNFINNNEAYPLIASIMKKYSFGHHDAYIFPEFQLGNSYRVDYLLVGKSSGGYEFLFVELEHPNEKIFLKDGYYGEAFRKGLKQVKDWRRWLDSNFVSLQETFRKSKNLDKALHEEFLVSDSTRWHFAVVAGRRYDFEKNKEYTYKLRREEVVNKIDILHYDNLYDMAKNIIGEVTY